MTSGGPSQSSDQAAEMASKNSDHHRSTPGRRRIKCTHPTCGKYGHFTSQCWVAHPDLRPRSVANRGRWWRGHEGTRANESAYENPNWLDGWGAMSDALPLRTPSPANEPFPFFELPQEIQNKIYEYVYEEKHGVKAFISGPLRDRRIVRYYEKGGEPTLVVYGYDYGGLAQVSKKVRQDSRQARKQAFNGRMRIVMDEDYYDLVFLKICEDMWAPLRSRVTELVFSGLSGRTADGGFDTLWKRIPAQFPQVSQINFRYNAYRYIFEGRDEPIFVTMEWSRLFQNSYADEFAAGQLDNEFAYPVDVLNLRDLARSLDEASHPCTIFLRTLVIWLNDRRCREHSQHVKFLVTLDQLEAIERA